MPNPSKPSARPADSATAPPEGAWRLLLSSVEADLPGGRFHLAGQRLLMFRPEAFVDLQKHLEGTLGLSSKGFLYLAGEKSAREDHSLFRDSVRPASGPEAAADVLSRSVAPLSLLGWGRFSVSVVGGEVQRFRVTLDNSPVAEAYGESKKPVCHLLAGFLAGAAERALGRDLLCEELSCRSQGKPQCEFELRPTPYL